MSRVGSFFNKSFSKLKLKGRDNGSSSRRSNSSTNSTDNNLALYELQKRIAQGSFGCVYVAQHKETRIKYAAKIVERSKLSESERTSILREVQILRDFQDVASVVNLVEFCETPQQFCVILELAQGGDVFRRLALRTSYTEALARKLAVGLLETIQILHDRNLVHRDLKPENLLLKDAMDDCSIVLADFGFAKYVPPEKLQTRCGTPMYVAPEVLLTKTRYDTQVDLWSVGCLLYMLIGGYPPFQARKTQELFRSIISADYVFHDKYWKNVSIYGKRLIASLLVPDPKHRLTAREALRSSKWLTLDEQILERNQLTESLGEIKKYQRNRIRKKKDNEQFEEEDYDDDEKEGTAADLDTLMRQKSESSLMQPGTLDSFFEKYELGNELKYGQTSTFECIEKETGRALAAQKIGRDPFSDASSENVYRQVALLESLDHPNVIQIHEFFESQDCFYFVMDRFDGGDLFEAIRQHGRLPEESAKAFAKSLLSAVAYLHERGIAHRDLKPQNLTLGSTEDCSQVAVGGFGFACRVTSSNSLTERLGTPTYVAPEVLKNAPYDHRVDLWSCGVTLFIAMVGYPPFHDENQAELFRKIRCGEYNFKGPGWKETSKEARKVIRGLLLTNPGQRTSAAEALASEWFLDQTDDDAMDTTD